ncbi:MAG: TonB-dependent receptor domain-containing protein [Spirosomataceae bacterium]
MKKLLLNLIYLFVSVAASAQTFSISGLVKNQQNEGVSFATTTLYKLKDSTLVKAEICTENGNFKINGIKPDKYYFVVSSVGFQKYRSVNFEVIDRAIDFSSIIINAENQLAEVKVKAQKPLVEVLADKTVFNVQSSLSATGTTGLELLRKSPGVVLDNNENVVLEGKTGVRIFIDGKPSILQGQDLTQYLKSLQASDIEAIEIITQPSARYDAAGNAGIINIRLKKDKRFGTNGSVAIGYGYGHYGKTNASVSFNHRTRKTNIFGTYSNRLGKNWSYLNFYREQVNTIFDQKAETINDNQSNNIKLGFDYFVSKNSTLGVILNSNFNANANSTFSRTPIFPENSTIPSQVLVADNTNNSNSRNLYLNSNYRYADTLGHVLNIDFDFGTYGNRRQSYQPNIYKNSDETQEIFSRIFKMNTPTDIGILSTKVDYEQNFLKGKLGLGVKFSVVKTDNTFDFFDVVDSKDVFNQNRSNNFVYTERINAAYISYNKSIKKVDLQLGLRAEQTISDGNLTSQQNNADSRVKRNYTNLFPSGGITYKANTNNSWGLTYSRRIERPTYQSLNPFEWQLDELTYQKGNAFLQPQYVDNLKLSHTYKYTLTTSLSYSFVRDFFAQITDTTGYNRNFLMERNIANQQVINLGISYPFQATKWWNVYLSVDAYHTNFKSDEKKFMDIRANVLSFYGQNTFSLPRKWNFEVSGWYSSPGIWGGTYVTRSQGSLDLALQKRILKEKVSFRLAMSDLFFTSPWRGSTQFGGLKIVGSGGWESRMVRVNLSYNFGNKQVKSARQRQTSLEDEKSRIN